MTSKLRASATIHSLYVPQESYVLQLGPYWEVVGCSGGRPCGERGPEGYKKVLLKGIANWKICLCPPSPI